MTELHVENLTLPGARLEEENPLPFFRDPHVDQRVNVRDSLPADKRHWLGWQTGLRVLPYRMQDRYTRQREPLTFCSIVLENEILKVTFLPELGGRLISLVHKPLERELLARNPVFQPANLAIRNAWFSGGIEWNVGQYGHTFATCSPVFAAAIQGPYGSAGLRLYEFERCKGLFWQLDLHLPPGSPFLIAHVRVVNPNDAETSMYWWTNIAVPEAPDVRVLAPADQAIYYDPAITGFGQAELPHLPTLDGQDSTYALNSHFADEFFFQCDDADMPWEAALDAQGSGLIEASTHPLRYRKLFCWGSHQGGRHWQEFLAPGAQPYIEIQAGLAPTQLHGLPVPAHSAWSWTQVFGYLEADPARVHGQDWRTAWQTVDGAFKSRLPMSQLVRLDQECVQWADVSSHVILQAGSGWGALELARRAREGRLADVPSAFVFPQATLGREQAKWLHLLERGCLPDQDPAEPPGEWMVQTEWRALLAESLTSPENRNWFALLHYGVMLGEAFDDQAAWAAWQESVRQRPSAWAFRNLGVLAGRMNRGDEALSFYDQAWRIAADSHRPDVSLAQEYLQVLCAAGQFGRAREVYSSLPPQVQEADRIQILRGRIALQLGDLDTVERVLGREYAVVREGETELTDLWFELWARRVSAQTGRLLDAALRQEVQQTHPPPAWIDFRSIN